MTSQSFIRREVAGVEAQGVAVRRHTLRRWHEALVDPLDLAERERTKAVLDVGAAGLIGATIATALRPSAVYSCGPCGERSGSAGVPGVRGAASTAI